jgi:hypothetical protein
VAIENPEKEALDALYFTVKGMNPSQLKRLRLYAETIIEEDSVPAEVLRNDNFAVQASGFIH